MGLVLAALVAAGAIGWYFASSASTFTGLPPNPQPANGGSVAGTGVSQNNIANPPVTLQSLQGNAGGPSTSQLVGFSSGVATSAVGIAASSGVIDTAGSLARSVPIAGAVVGIGLSIYNMITAHHKQAVALQLKCMQVAVPAFYEETNSVMAALNSGQLTENQAIDLLQQVKAAYYSNVAPFIKQSGALKPFDFVGTSAPANPSYFVVKDSANWKDAATGEHCNAGCAFGAGASATIMALTNVITNHGGSYTMPPFGDPTDGLSVPATTWTYARG